MPDLPVNKEKLAGFPVSIAEVVNASFSPLRHTIRHMTPWTAKSVIAAMVGVHNLKALMTRQERKFWKLLVSCTSMVINWQLNNGSY